MNIEKLKYPIGKYTFEPNVTKDIVTNWIADIKSFPEQLKKEVNFLTEMQLETAYRPDGWTIRQVIHHCADSHMNSFIRIKLALTENQPIIKPYFEEKWAELVDSKNMPIEPSLRIIKGIHQRWTVLLNSLTDEELDSIFFHPEHMREIKIKDTIGLYAWHCNHHLAHITETKKAYKWS